MTNEKMYEKTLRGLSVFSGEMVDIVGEITIDGRQLYLYNIAGYTAQNGKPFAALKENIMIEKN